MDKIDLNAIIREKLTMYLEFTANQEMYMKKCMKEAIHQANNELIKYITSLASQSFEGWSTEAKDAYITALVSIRHHDSLDIEKLIV